MAIRLRNYYNMPEPGDIKAVCAAEEPEMCGDLYLHDGVHQALADKFMADRESTGLMPTSEALQDLADLRSELKSLVYAIEKTSNPKNWNLKRAKRLVGE